MAGCRRGAEEESPDASCWMRPLGPAREHRRTPHDPGAHPARMDTGPSRFPATVAARMSSFWTRLERVGGDRRPSLVHLD
jgi:hypothetical protein